MVVDTILYDRLSISPNATEKEIKKSYHKLSMKWHPDKNKSEEATTKFQEISEAYSILSDNQKRQEYDNMGIDMLKGGGGMNVDPSEIFKHFMGGFPGGGFGGGPFGGSFPGGPFGDFSSFMGGPFRNPQNRSFDNEDCVVRVNVTLEQIYNQEEINVKYEQKNYCVKCNGYGTSDGIKSECSKCNGSGKITITRQMGNMIQQMIRTCDICNGTGESNKNKCKECNGNKFKLKEKNIDIKLNNNLNDNHQVKINNKGHNLRDGRSDLIIVINILPHDKFIKDGDDLHMRSELKFYQYLFGLNKVINHLDNRNLMINVKEFKIDNIGDEIIVKVNNEGMNNSGDLIIHFTLSNLKIDSLENNEKEILKKILMKCDIKDFKKEIKIINSLKDNLVNTTSEQISHIDIEDNNPDPGPDTGPECVQQ